MKLLSVHLLVEQFASEQAFASIRIFELFRQGLPTTDQFENDTATREKYAPPFFPKVTTSSANSSLEA